ncbi:MAG: restriction endonuclease subunit S [Aliarcobacter sp.]|nr:restriction endonuclease subunit S [Aliarcobacter sp.]
MKTITNDKLLENMAEELYKEWFVRLRFPNYQNTKTVDGILEGWEESILEKECTIIMGQSPKSAFYNEEKEGLPFHQGVSNYGFRFPVNEFWSTDGNRIAKKGEILFSVRAPVGRLNIANEEIIIGRGLSSINHKNDLNSYLFYHLKNTFYKDNIIGSGSIFESVTRKDVENIKILKSNNVINQFNLLAKNIDLEVEKLILKNQNLKETRDLLLPRVISGKLDIKDLHIV